MKNAIAKFYDYLDRPLAFWTRPVLALLVIPLAMAFTAPLWRISLAAPQYPKGLYMEIWAHKIEGGNNGQHIKEINTLNHYIGMHKIDRAELSDLDWIPFALATLGLLTLRCAAIGNIRMLLDLLVMTAYVGAFSMGRFVYKMYVFGHNLDPTAALKVPPFTPAIFGTKQIANFSTTSYPEAATIWIGVFATGVAALALGHLVVGRIRAVRAERA